METSGRNLRNAGGDGSKNASKSGLNDDGQRGEKMKEAFRKYSEFATGGFAGGMAGAFVMGSAPMEIYAQEVDQPEELDVVEVVEVEPADTHHHHVHHQTSSPAPQTPTSQTQNIQEPEVSVSPDPCLESHQPQNIQQPAKPQQSENEVEVIGYERYTMDDGSQVDIAVVNYSGEEVAFVDVDLDGRADIVMCDLNHDGVLQEDEKYYVKDEVIEMKPLQEAAGFNVLYAQDTIPDYENNADVDTFWV